MEINQNVTSIQTKKSNAAVKGAKIGAGVAAGVSGLSAVSIKALASINNDTFVNTLKKTYDVNNAGKAGAKYAGAIALAFALYTAIGYGIGKLIQNHKAKKESKQESNLSLNG